MRRSQKDAIVAFAVGSAFELAIMVANYVLLARPQLGWLDKLTGLITLQSVGAAIAERLYPHVGYATSLVAGCSLNAGLFGVFILGLIGVYRAIRAAPGFDPR